MRLATPFDIRRELRERMADLGSSRRSVVMRQLAPIGGDWRLVGTPGQPGFATVDTIYGPPGVTVDLPGTSPDPKDTGAVPAQQWSSPFFAAGTGFGPPSFLLNTENFVHMRGVVGWRYLDECPILMFVLPEGCRPTASVYRSTVITHPDPADGQRPSQITIDSSGGVWLTTEPYTPDDPLPAIVTDSGPPNFYATTAYWIYSTIWIPLDGIAFTLG